MFLSSPGALVSLASPKMLGYICNVDRCEEGPRRRKTEDGRREEGAGALRTAYGVQKLCFWPQAEPAGGWGAEGRRLVSERHASRFAPAARDGRHSI